MDTKDFELIDKGEDVIKAVDKLDSETNVLARINDAPGVSEAEVEDFFTALFRVVAAIFKH